MGRRKRSTWGGVERLPSGRWRVRWREGGRRRSETIDGTRKDAEHRLAEIRVRVGDEPTRPTVGYAWERWTWPIIERTGKPSTVRRYRDSWRLHVAPRWERVTVDGVTPVEVQEWLDGMTASVAEFALIVLRRILDRAVEMEAVPRNRAKGRFVMPTAGETRSREVLTRRQMAALCEGVRGERFEPCVILACWAGLRPGETLGVMVGEVAEMGDVAIVPVVRQVSCSGEVMEPKTRAGTRTVAIPQPWAARLLEIQDEARERGDVWLVDDGLGDPANQNLLGKWWKRLDLDGLGVPRVPLHNLRASFETVAHWDRGMDVGTVAKLMGHSQPTITHAVYDRPDAERVAVAVSRAFSGTV